MIWNKNYFSFNMKGDVRYMIWEAAVCLVKTIYIGNCQTYSIDGFELWYFSLPISSFIQPVYIFLIKSMLAITRILNLYLVVKNKYLIFHVTTGTDWIGGTTTNILVRYYFDPPIVPLQYPITNQFQCGPYNQKLWTVKVKILYICRYYIALHIKI